MRTTNTTEGLRQPTVTRKAYDWYIARAIVFIALGIGSILEPVVAGLAITIFMGWLLIFAGIGHFLGLFRTGGPWRVVWQFNLGILYIVGGIYFVTHPHLGLGTLTLLLAVILVLEAILEFVAYIRSRSNGGSVWMLAKGLITLVLSALIWLHWPSSSLWAVGTLVGVNLLMTGISRLMPGMAARKLASAAAG